MCGVRKTEYLVGKVWMNIGGMSRVRKGHSLWEMCGVIVGE